MYIDSLNCVFPIKSHACDRGAKGCVVRNWKEDVCFVTVKGGKEGDNGKFRENPY